MFFGKTVPLLNVFPFKYGVGLDARQGTFAMCYFRRVNFSDQIEAESSVDDAYKRGKTSL